MSRRKQTKPQHFLNKEEKLCAINVNNHTEILTQSDTSNPQKEKRPRSSISQKHSSLGDIVHNHHQESALHCDARPGQNHSKYVEEEMEPDYKPHHPNQRNADLLEGYSKQNDLVRGGQQEVTDPSQASSLQKDLEEVQAFERTQQKSDPTKFDRQPSELGKNACHFCGDIKDSPAELEEHISQHTGEYPFKCETCYTTFKSKRALQYHRHANHEIGMMTDKLSSKADSEKHPQNNPKIDQEGSTEGESHIAKASTKAGRVPNEDWNDSMSMHSSHSQDSEVLSDKNNNESVGSPANTHRASDLVWRDSPLTLGKYVETVLSNYGAEALSDSYDLKQTGETSSQQGESVSEKGPSTPTMTQESSVYQSQRAFFGNLDTGYKNRHCQYCGKLCPKPSDMKRHMLVHTGERPFACRVCGKGFKSKASTLYHEKAAHGMNVELSQGLEERYLRLKANQEHKKFLQMKSIPLSSRMDSELDDTDQESIGTIPKTGSIEDGDKLSPNLLSPVGQEPESPVVSKYDSTLDLSKVRPSLAQDFESPTVLPCDSTPELSKISPTSSASSGIHVGSEGSEGGEDFVIEYPSNFPGLKQKLKVRNETVLVTRLEGINMTTRSEAELFKCHLCHRLFNFLSQLQCHLSMHFDKYVTLFECPLCGHKAKFKSQLKQHAKQRHGLSYVDLMEISSATQGLPFEDHMDMSSSNTQGLSYAELMDPSAHNKHLPHSRNITTDPADPSQHDKVLHNCDENKGEDMRASMMEESCGETEKQTYNQNFTSGDLPKHTFDPDLGLNIPRGRGFYSTRKRKQHKRVNGLFVCQYCNKSFYRSYCLERHLRVHTGYKPCFCQICKKGFSEWRNLRQHIARFHSHFRKSTASTGQESNSPDSPPSLTLEQSLRGPTSQNSEPIEKKDGKKVCPIVIEPNEGTPGDERKFDDDVTVVIPSDVPLDQVGHQAPGLPSWNDIAGPDKGDGTAGSEIGTAPVKSLMNFRPHVKVRRQTSQHTPPHTPGSKTAEDKPFKGEPIDTKPEIPLPVATLKVEPNGDNSLHCGDHSLGSGLISPPGSIGLLSPHHNLHTLYMPQSPLFPTTVLPGQFPYMAGLFPTLIQKPSMATAAVTKENMSAASRARSQVWTSQASSQENSNRLMGLSRSSSLSRTHSRLNVVRTPIRREDACKPTVLPDGRTVYRCSYCLKDFASYSDINRHMDFHEDIRPYKCKFCDYYARTNSQLKVHMMRHQGIREFHCKLCNYKGVTQSDLNRHMKSQIHVMKAQNACHLCGEGFVSYKNLEVHKVVCTGTRRDSDKHEKV